MKRSVERKHADAVWYLFAGLMLFGPLAFFFLGESGPLAVIAGVIAAAPFAGVTLQEYLERHPAVLLTAKESGRSPRYIASLIMVLPIMFGALLWAILPNLL